MRKFRHQRKKPAGLVKIQKNLDKQDLRGRTAPEGEFRIIGVNQSNKTVWIEDTVSTFAKAKEVVDTFKGRADVIYYVHNDSNRIIYDSKKE